MSCEVCKHPRAAEVMMRVFAGDLTYVDAASALRLPVPTVWHCMKEHWQAERQGDRIILKEVTEAKTTEDFVGLMRKSVQRFIGRLDQAMGLPVSAYNEGAVTKLSAELRALMRDILEFEGKLQSAPLIQLSLIQVQMHKLTSFLFSALCDADREKLMKVLPELMKVEPTRTPAEITASTT